MSLNKSKKINKNVENVYNQMCDTMEYLMNTKIASYTNIPEVNVDLKNSEAHITWPNQTGGRIFCGKNFTSIKQYMEILKTNAYQLLLYDNSIIRCSYKFKGSKLLSQNLLWWPCPVSLDEEMILEWGLLETVECYLQDKNCIDSILMRSPVRIDFDVENDKEEHPKAHMHTQHHECRINTSEPICFNKFISFIIKCYYPQFNIRLPQEDYLKLSYNKGKNVIYNNRTQIILG